MAQEKSEINPLRFHTVSPGRSRVFFCALYAQACWFLIISLTLAVRLRNRALPTMATFSNLVRLFMAVRKWVYYLWRRKKEAVLGVLLVTDFVP